MSTRQVRPSADAQFVTSFEEGAPLDQELVDASVSDPAAWVNPSFVEQADREFSSALEAVQGGIAVGYEFTLDDVTDQLSDKADTGEFTTDRTLAENKKDSSMGVVAELVVQSYLAELGFRAEDTEHWNKKDGDLVVKDSGTTIEVKARELSTAYSAGFDDFPIRHRGFAADLGVLVLVDVEDARAVIVAWEHGEELDAFTHAYSPAQGFNDDDLEGGGRWVYPFRRLHSINTLPAVLQN